MGRGVMDLEALASYRPTVVLHRVGDPKTVEAVEKLGIRTLCISAEDMEGVKDLSLIHILQKLMKIEGIQNVNLVEQADDISR